MGSWRYLFRARRERSTRLGQLPPLAERALLGLEVESGRVDAVAQTGLIPGTIFKDMAQMAAALGAIYLGPSHAVTVVVMQLDVALADDVPETGPAGSGMELRFRREQHIATSGANVSAILFGIDVFAGERPFRPRLAQDMILLIGESLPPLLFCFGYFFHATSLFVNRIFDKERASNAAGRQRAPLWRLAGLATNLTPMCPKSIKHPPYEPGSPPIQACRARCQTPLVVWCIQHWPTHDPQRSPGKAALSVYPSTGRWPRPRDGNNSPDFHLVGRIPRS